VLCGQWRFSPDGCYVVSASNDCTLRLWELSSGALSALRGHENWVTDVVFSQDGRHVVSSSYDGTLRLWELASGRELARLDGDRAFCAIGLAPDGEYLAAGDSAGFVHFIDMLIDSADKTAWLARSADHT